MTETTAALAGALIGALAGTAGAGLAALASVRSTQIGARAPLASKIHSLNQAVVQLGITSGTPGYMSRLKDFQVAWNDFIVHQKILVPSRRLGIMSDLLLAASTDPSVTPAQFIMLAGDVLSAAANIIARHSEHVFRWRATIAERSVVKELRSKSLAAVQSPLLRAMRDEL